MKMLSHLDNFTPGISLKSWAFTIMRNTFITEYKRQKRMAATWDSPELCEISVPSTQQGFVYLRRLAARWPAFRHAASGFRHGAVGLIVSSGCAKLSL